MRSNPVRSRFTRGIDLTFDPNRSRRLRSDPLAAIRCNLMLKILFRERKSLRLEGASDLGERIRCDAKQALNKSYGEGHELLATFQAEDYLEE